MCDYNLTILNNFLFEGCWLKNMHDDETRIDQRLVFGLRDEEVDIKQKEANIYRAWAVQKDDAISKLQLFQGSW